VRPGRPTAQPLARPLPRTLPRALKCCAALSALRARSSFGTWRQVVVVSATCRHEPRASGVAPRAEEQAGLAERRRRRAPGQRCGAHGPNDGLSILRCVCVRNRTDPVRTQI
jgi:hypothetical protein